MADQVTISTFLELRDNMSEGLQRVADALQILSGKAPAAQTALNNMARTAEQTSKRIRKARSDEERDAERAQKRSEAFKRRIEINSARMASRENANRLTAEQRYQAALANAQFKDAQREIILAERTARKAREAQERLEKQRRRMEAASANAAATAAQRAAAEAAKAAAARIREEQKVANFRRRIEINSAKTASAEAAKAADARIREEQRVAAWRRRIEINSARQASRDHERSLREKERVDKKPGLFGSLLKANILADFVTDTIPAAFGALKQHLVTVAEQGKEYEDAINRIALSLTGLNLAPSMRAAVNETEQLYGILRDMAAKLPGETQDYVQVFAQGLPDALTAGMTDTKKYAEFVSKYTAIAISRGVGSARAATDLEQILEGRARITTRTYAELRPYIGMLSKDFNKLAPVERFERLQKAVLQAASGVDTLADSANAKFGEFMAHVQELYTIGEKPLFEAIKSTISDINELFVKNRKEIMSTAALISTHIGDALRGLVPVVEIVYRRITDMVTAIESSTVLSKLANFATMHILELGGSTRALGAAMRERERTEKAQGVYRKYESLIPSVRGLSGAALDRQFKYLWQAGMPFLQTGRGAEVFKSKEDWDAFVTSITGNKDKAMELWKQMIKEGTVETFKMPHREAEDEAGGRRRGRTLRTAPETRPQQTFDFRHSRFDIKQEFAEGYDPDRIAVAFANDLGRLGEMKLQGAYGLAGSVR